MKHIRQTTKKRVIRRLPAPANPIPGPIPWIDWEAKGKEA